jgi:hypothetical protein
MGTAKSHVLAAIQESIMVRVVWTNTFQKRVKHDWRHWRNWCIHVFDSARLLKSPSAGLHTLNLPQGRVTGTDAKEHLSLDARRIGDRFVKALVDTPNHEKRLRWETFENTLENSVVLKTLSRGSQHVESWLA